MGVNVTITRLSALVGVWGSSAAGSKEREMKVGGDEWQRQGHGFVTLTPGAEPHKIGRASCRERG